MGKIELLCLGTGDHVSAVYEHVSSSSFVLLADGFPVLLIGCGLGTARACQHYVHMVPECVLLLNGSASQCAELGAMVAVETQKGRHLKIFAEASYCDQVVEQLRGDIRDESCRLVDPTAVAVVRLSVIGDLSPIVGDFAVLLHRNTHRREGLSPAVSAVIFYREMAAVALAGPAAFDATLIAKLSVAPFVVAWVAGTSAAASARVCAGGTSVNDIVLFCDRVNASRPVEEKLAFLLTGYGPPAGAPMIAGYVSVAQVGTPVVLLAGDFVQTAYGALSLSLYNVRKAGSRGLLAGGDANAGAAAATANGRAAEPSAAEGATAPPHLMSGSASASLGLRPRSSSAEGGTAMAASILRQPGGPALETAGGRSGGGRTVEQQQHYDPATAAIHPDAALRDPMMVGGGQPRGGTAAQPKRVFLFNNENKAAPGRLLMLSAVRTVGQLLQRASQALRLKPIQSLHFGNGRPVRALDEISDCAELVAVCRAGAPYDVRDPPRLMKSSSLANRSPQ